MSHSSIQCTFYSGQRYPYLDFRAVDSVAWYERLGFFAEHRQFRLVQVRVVGRVMLHSAGGRSRASR